MSLFPQETIEAFRHNINTIIDIYGFEADLFVAENVEVAEGLDVYAENPKTQYKEHYAMKVFVVWNPTSKLLRSIGMHVEDDIPIIAWLRSDIEVTRNSYMRIPINFSPVEFQNERFELIDQVARNSYNATVVQAWKIVPFRENREETL